MNADRLGPLAPVPVLVKAGADDTATLDRAATVARKLDLPLASTETVCGEYPLLLMVFLDRLELAESHARRQRPIAVDFLSGPTAQRRTAPRGLRELIARAIGDRSRHGRVIDATAGLARDAFLLAALGYEVLAIERSAVLAAMIWDAIVRAGSAWDPALKDLAKRLRVVNADARDYLSALPSDARPDVVYLDPMYETSRGSALAKKEMRILRRLVGNDPDAGELLDAALATAKRRVVVKRHRHAPPLAEGVSHEIIGTRVRFDVYMMAKPA